MNENRYCLQMVACNNCGDKENEEVNKRLDLLEAYLGGLRFFSDLTQLGLNYGCSILDIITAMPLKSVGIFWNNDADGRITGCPENAGTITIKKMHEARVSITFESGRKATGGGTYRRYYNTNEFVSDWVKLG